MAYNNNRAKIDWPDAAAPNGRDLNDIGATIRNWGFGTGSVPGDFTVEADRSKLNNLGVLNFGTTGGFEDGTLAAPGMRFASDQNNGQRLSAADTVQQVAGGVAVLTFTPTVITSPVKFVLDNALGSDAMRIGSGVDYYQVGRTGASGFLTFTGVQNTFSGYDFYTKIGGVSTLIMRIDNNGTVAEPLLPSSNPGAGSKKRWYDPADGNRVKYAP